MYKPDILISYANINAFKASELRAEQDRFNLFLDSGAFTAFNLGEPIDLAEYTEFVRNPPFRIERYFMLDVIGDPTKTMRNYERMRSDGTKPVPVFTRGAPWEHLRVFNKDSDLVACGGLVSKTQQPVPYIKAVSKRISLGKVHLLGFARRRWLPSMRPYSCDASSWQKAKLYGSMDLYMGGGQFAGFDAKTLPSAPRHVIDRVRHYGFEPATLWCKKTGWSGMKAPHIALEAISWVDYARDVRARFGVRLFFVCVGMDHLRYLLAATRRLQEAKAA